MKRFEAIDERIKFLEAISLGENGEQLLSELKQITDEHSEMVEMLNYLFENNMLSVVGDEMAEQLLTKINNK